VWTRFNWSLKVSDYLSHSTAFAQAVSRRPSPRRPGLVHVRFVVDEVALIQVLLRVIQCFHQYHFTVVLHIRIILGMNNRPVGGRSSETQLYPINMNSNFYTTRLPENLFSQLCTLSLIGIVNGCKIVLINELTCISYVLWRRGCKDCSNYLEGAIFLKFVLQLLLFVVGDRAREDLLVLYQ
jgi:hypothetical protein